MPDPGVWGPAGRTGIVDATDRRGTTLTRFVDGVGGRVLGAVKQLVGTSLSLATSRVRAAADRLLSSPSEDTEDADSASLERGLKQLEASIEEGLERAGRLVGPRAWL